VIEATPVVLAVTGVGKVAAAIATQLVCDRFNPRFALTFGLAGAGDGDRQAGQLIVATGAVQHDLDARPLTNAKGIVPSLGMAMFASDPVLSASLLRATGLAVGDRDLVRAGLVLTGDQIVTSRAVRDGLLHEFPGGLCFDMETAAIAQVAYQNHVPWCALRMTSDAADESFNLEEVFSFGINTASDLFDRIIRAFLRDLQPV
jgi:adenosylhomocysteine nucleosidase